MGDLSIKVDELIIIEVFYHWISFLVKTKIQTLGNNHKILSCLKEMWILLNGWWIITKM